MATITHPIPIANGGNSTPLTFPGESPNIIVAIVIAYKIHL
jgi:hypothetical protein